MSFFDSISELPEDAILGLAIAFAADPNPKKVNLGIGAYKTADNQSLLLTCVAEAEEHIAKEHRPKDYLPIDGDPLFLKLSLPILFGKNSPHLANGHIAAIQSIGGTGALRIGGEFIAGQINPVIYLSDPTWVNHGQVFEQAGLKVHYYPYYDYSKNSLNFDALCASIKKMPASSVIVLQGCCHNPTGIDPTFEQWKELSSLIKKQRVLPFFDFAYQGFNTDLEGDAKALRYFVEQGHELLVSYSYSKNFGLYGERIGFLAAVTDNPETAKKMTSQFKQLIRSNYSNPATHGARIISTVLSSDKLTLQWTQELQNMRDRIVEMRMALTTSLMVKAEHLDFSFMHNQVGMFSFCGLDQSMVTRLKKEKGLYMPNNGRINVAGISTLNLDYVAEAIASVMHNDH